jgi:hypothetical protein
VIRYVVSGVLQSRGRIGRSRSRHHVFGRTGIVTGRCYRRRVVTGWNIRGDLVGHVVSSDRAGRVGQLERLSGCRTFCRATADFRRRVGRWQRLSKRRRIAGPGLEIAHDFRQVVQAVLRRGRQFDIDGRGQYGKIGRQQQPRLQRFTRQLFG